jgi:Mrp family chromosome partitioning ATPase/capsular polysaccharide biosynthesis protein
MALTYLRLHWLTILFCGSLLGAGLAYAAWTLLPSKYESYALLQVSQSAVTIGEMGDPNRGRTAFGTYVRTQATLIKSEFVLNAALNDTKYRIGELPTLKEQKDPIRYLDEKLVVSSSDGSEIIRISLEGDRPDDLQKIVNAVKDAYLRELPEKEHHTRGQLKDKVEKAQLALKSRLEHKVGPAVPAGGAPAPLPPSITDPNGIQQATAVAPVAAGDPDWLKRIAVTVALGEVPKLRQEINRLPLTINAKKAEIADLKLRLEALKKTPPGPDVLAEAERDPEVVGKLKLAAALREAYENKRRVVGDPSSDAVLRLKADADMAEAEAIQLRNEKALLREGAVRKQQAMGLFERITEAERQLGSLTEQLDLARKLLADNEKIVLEAPPPPEKPAEPKGPKVDLQMTDLVAHNQKYADLTTQLIALELELQAPPRVTKRQDASAPVQKDPKKQIIATIAAALAGFALIGLGLVAVETRARKVSSLAELQASGPTPVVGVIPWQPDGSTARDPVKRADVNEAVDKLRAYVSQTWLSKGATTVAVTSPLGDEGKSFTAFGLASSLAQAGYRTLLVDFDLRHPSLHPLAGVGNEAGVCELLRGESDPRTAVVVLPNGLYFLPAGKWSDEARQAAVGGRLEGLLTRLKEPFDVVVLHGHALLTVAESVEIARRSEVVLLCSLYRETRLPLLKRAADRVATMEVPYSGVVYLGATANEALC